MPVESLANVAYLALGANLGRRMDNLRGAVTALTDAGDIRCMRRSQVYETSAVGGPPGQNDYLNAVIEVRTSLSAWALLERCLATEARLGRVRGAPCGPRVIDIDLLLFNDETIAAPHLHVPHPRMYERGFVLAPLAQLVPDLRHPTRGVTIAALHDALPPNPGGLRMLPSAVWTAPDLAV